MSNRQAILEGLRKRLDAGNTLDERRGMVARRIGSKTRGVTPEFANTKGRMINRFVSEAEKAEASVERVKASDAGKAVKAFLRAHNLPASIRMGDDKRLDPVAKSIARSVDISKGPSDGNDVAGLSHAECGVAETGTLGLLSGSGNPTTVNFLPENHIVIVNEKDIVQHYEDLWDRIREGYGQGNMPRTVNLVTGPSRSADIEQTLILGAHGPVRLHIILVS